MPSRIVRAAVAPLLSRRMATQQTRRPVVLLGHPALREVCLPCGEDPLTDEKAALTDTLKAFREAHGFGRGIAAPQIGIPRRFVAIHMPPPVGRRVLCDPVVTWRSEEMFELFDDCMSLPWLLCVVRRNKSVSVEFTNEAGEREEWAEMDTPLSELLQVRTEMDTLATSRNDTPLSEMLQVRGGHMIYIRFSVAIYMVYGETNVGSPFTHQTYYSL